MSTWHEPAANIGLRAGGFVMLCLAVALAAALYHQVHAHPVREASLGELGLSALFVLSMLIGAVLLVVGPGLWKRIEIPGRRSFIFDDNGPISLMSERQRLAGINEGNIQYSTSHESIERAA